MKKVTEIAKQVSIRIAALSVLLGLVSVYYLWTLNPLSNQSETTFALFLALDLVAFAMISYIYRVDKRGDSIGRAALIVGCCFALLLLFAGLFA
jgi:hypothetical protein